MSIHSIRFIHSSDWHLEQPLGGLVNIPSSLRDAFIDAPFQAAELVVDTAINEDVDLVILSGDIIDIELAGPRAIDFLLRQFERLNEKKIRIYWAGGKIDDPDLWPTELALPKRVHVFQTGHPESVEFRRKDRCVATITGQSYRDGQTFRATDFSNSKSEGAKIAVAYGEAETRTMLRESVDYWAFGGRHTAEDLFHETSIARYSGNPQGFNPREHGSHSCTIVQIEHGRTHMRTVATDVVRWHRERLDLSDDADKNDLEREIRQRAGALKSDREDQLTLVCWAVSCAGPLGRELYSTKLCDQILSSLNVSNKGVVSACIEPDTRSVSLNRHDDDSILGDFLRTVREFEEDPGRIINLADLLPDTSARHELISVINDWTPADRQRILRRVATLGMDLLNDESNSTSS